MYQLSRRDGGSDSRQLIAPPKFYEDLITFIVILMNNKWRLYIPHIFAGYMTIHFYILIERYDIRDIRIYKLTIFGKYNVTIVYFFYKRLQTSITDI